MAVIIPFPRARQEEDPAEYPEYYEPVCGLCTYQRSASSSYSNVIICAHWCKMTGEALPAAKTCEAWEGNF